jgi:hypothetical protein
VTDKEKENGLSALAPMSTRTKNTVDELTRLHVKGIANKGETEFDALNAFTELLTHGMKLATTPLGRRFAASEYGNAADEKADFVRLLTQHEKTGERPRLEAAMERGERLLAMVK